MATALHDGSIQQPINYGAWAAPPTAYQTSYPPTNPTVTYQAPPPQYQPPVQTNPVPQPPYQPAPYPQPQTNVAYPPPQQQVQVTQPVPQVPAPAVQQPAQSFDWLDSLLNEPKPTPPQPQPQPQPQPPQVQQAPQAYTPLSAPPQPPATTAYPQQIPQQTYAPAPYDTTTTAYPPQPQQPYPAPQLTPPPPTPVPQAPQYVAPPQNSVFQYDANSAYQHPPQVQAAVPPPTNYDPYNVQAQAPPPSAQPPVAAYPYTDPNYGQPPIHPTHLPPQSVTIPYPQPPTTTPPPPTPYPNLSTQPYPDPNPSYLPYAPQPPAPTPAQAFPNPQGGYPGAPTGAPYVPVVGYVGGVTSAQLQVEETAQKIEALRKKIEEHKRKEDEILKARQQHDDEIMAQRLQEQEGGVPDSLMLAKLGRVQPAVSAKKKQEEEDAALAARLQAEFSGGYSAPQPVAPVNTRRNQEESDAELARRLQAEEDARLRGNVPAPVAPVPTQWSCNRCTLVNPANAPACVACNNPNPIAPPRPATTAPYPQPGHPSGAPIDEKSQWVPDDLVKQCMGQGCTTQFGLLERRHHCRRCGGVFCGKCTPHKIQIPGESKPQRACGNCFAATSRQ